MVAFQGNPQLISAIEIVSIILSVVALIITTVGFFASLKFYRDGVNLQNKANDALTKLEERTQFIQTQVGGMFDKTLEAAIGKSALVEESFATVNHQLEETKLKIIDEALLQIGAAGEQERRRIAEIVTAQIDLVREKVDIARESAEEVTSDLEKPMTLKESSILRTLLEEGGPMQAWQISKRRTALSSTSETLYLSARLMDRGLVGYAEGGLVLTTTGKKIAERIADLNPHVVDE